MTPTGWLAVAPSGDDAAAELAPHPTVSAALAHPLRSLQEALRRSLPGSVVLVREGSYAENLDISRLGGRQTGRGLELGLLSAEQPLCIVGADGFDAVGRPKARLIGAEQRSTIFVNGVSHVRLHNLEIGGIAGLGATDDEAPLKFIGGADDLAPEEASGWLEVAGCRIVGEGVDAFKAAKGQHLSIVGCRFDVSVPESMVDFVSILDSEVRDCEFYGHAKDGASAKGASGRILWDGNIFRYSGLYCCAIGWNDPAITIGGISWSQVVRDMPPDRWNVECFDSVARRNLFAGEFEHAVVFWGARDCVAERNFVAHTGAPGRPWGARYAWRVETAPSYPWRNQWLAFADGGEQSWPEVRATHGASLDTLGYAPSSGNIVRDNTYLDGAPYGPGFSRDRGGGATPNRIEGTMLGSEAEWRASVGPIGLEAFDPRAIYAALGLPA